MTIIPFAPRAAAPPSWRHVGNSACLTAGFAAPAGGRGHFTGWYRLERWLPGFDGGDVVGVFTGTLTDAGGRTLALVARRRLSRARAVRGATGWWLALEPVEVDLAGFVLLFSSVAVPIGAPAAVSSRRSRS